VKTARTGRGINPYRNAVLKDLFERGRANPGGGGPGGLRPKGEIQQPAPAPTSRPSPSQRDPLTRGRRDPRDPMPRRRF
jgi:hypothetical protein